MTLPPSQAGLHSTQLATVLAAIPKYGTVPVNVRDVDRVPKSPEFVTSVVQAAHPGILPSAQVSEDLIHALLLMRWDAAESPDMHGCRFQIIGGFPSPNVHEATVAAVGAAVAILQGHGRTSEYLAWRVCQWFAIAKLDLWEQVNHRILSLGGIHEICACMKAHPHSTQLQYWALWTLYSLAGRSVEVAMTLYYKLGICDLLSAAEANHPSDGSCGTVRNWVNAFPGVFRLHRLT